MKSTPTKRKASSKDVSASGAGGESAAPAGDRQEHIATSAYYKAQARGFMAGLEFDDWIAAEAEYDASAEQRP